MAKYGKLQVLEEVSFDESKQVLKLIFKDDEAIQERIWSELTDGTSLRDQLWNNSDFISMLKEEPDVALMMIDLLSRRVSGPNLRYQDVANEEFTAAGCNFLESEVLFDGWFQLMRVKLQYQRFDGVYSDPHEHVVMVGSSGVSILLYDPELDNVVLIEEFRAGMMFKDNPYLLGVVTGGLEKGELPKDGAIREAKEEAGLTPYAVRELLTYMPVAAFSDNVNYGYIGLVKSEDAGGVHGMENENEDIRVRVIPFDDALAMVSEGKIVNGPAVTSLLYFALHKESILKDV